MKKLALVAGVVVLLAVLTVAAASAIVAGAGFTTFDAVQDGCLDSPNGIDCNNYKYKEDVYMNGGPTGGAGLTDGDYYFAVLVPGYQNGGFLDGAMGNLSDTTAGGTKFDYGSGDAASNRTFTVTGGLISFYGGTHATGTSPNGKYIIQLMPYDDTSNNGGVYILAVCQVGATSPSQCKYDAFRVKKRAPIKGVIEGLKYFDSNMNGQWDAGEPGLANWPIDYSNGVAGTLYTGAGGTFSLEVAGPDTLHFAEQQAAWPWFQTGNTVDQTSATGSCFASLANFEYDVTITESCTVSGLNFGNVCIVPFDGRTPGFWQGPNGQALITDADLAVLRALHLVWPDGSAFDPYDKTELITFNEESNAQNMASQLSRHLGALQLNVLQGFVDGNAIIFGDGRTVNQLIAEADASLALYPITTSDSPERAAQAALKNAIAGINEGTSGYVPTGPQQCPAPGFGP